MDRLKQYAVAHRPPDSAETPLKCWIDKFCLTTDDLALTVACLPIYLMSCKHFVILAGPNWLNSLWSMFELYVYVEMGGAPQASPHRPPLCYTLAHHPHFRLPVSPSPLPSVFAFALASLSLSPSPAALARRL